MKSSATDTRWITRREVEELLGSAGMPHSRATVERLVAETDETGFPLPRQWSANSTRLWDRELVVAWIARSRCSSTPDAAERAA